MRRPCVHLEHLLHLLARQRRLRQHAPHSLFDHALGVLREQRLERREALVPHVTGVVEIALLLKLPARELDPLRVHDDDAVSPFTYGVKVGLCLPRKICATQLASRPSGCPAASTKNQRRTMSCGLSVNVFMSSRDPEIRPPDKLP